MRSAALWVAGSLVVLGGCGSPLDRPPEPVVRTVTLEVEVPTKCIKNAPRRPAVRAPEVIARQPPGPGVAELGASYGELWDYAARWEALGGTCVVVLPTVQGAEGSVRARSESDEE